jgi:hypothetical protein
LRTRTLEAFNESFDKALEKEGFAAAARNCTQTFLEKFDKGSEGMLSGLLINLYLAIALKLLFYFEINLIITGVHCPSMINSVKKSSNGLVDF